MAQDEIPKVVGGKLTHPYPIKTRGDVSRARVLPPPAVSQTGKLETYKAPAAPVTPKSPSSEQPQGGFDYVMKRNKLQKEIQGRAPVQRRLTSR